MCEALRSGWLVRILESVKLMTYHRGRVNGSETNDKHTGGQCPRFALWPFGGVHEPLQHIVLSSKASAEARVGQWHD